LEENKTSQLDGMFAGRVPSSSAPGNALDSAAGFSVFVEDGRNSTVRKVLPDYSETFENISEE
jgi:hypothetical protein